MTKGLFHERVEAGRRLVEQQEVGPGHEGADEEDLLAVSLRVGAHLLGRVEIESFDQVVAVGGVHLALDPAEEVEGLGAGERGPEIGLAGHVGQAPMRLDRLASAVEPEDLGPAGARPGQPQEEANGGGLPGAVGPQVADNLTLGDLEIEVLQGVDVAVALGQTFGPDGRRAHWALPLVVFSTS